ncbi:prolyl-tRNA editing protein [Halobacteriales archaeon QS_3_64_16]|nr:MAG: prolyl-tRNA editing protein [Halobacteriales archaeon QS_3_64_16]
MHPRAAEFKARVEAEYDLAIEIREFPGGAESAADAARAIGCEPARIASSLVFRASGIVVAVASGATRMSEAKLTAARGVSEDEVGMASPESVRETIGWSIGGVPPFAHDREEPVYVDETLEEFAEVWAAAGTPQAVFPIAPADIRVLAGAESIEVAESPTDGESS